MESIERRFIENEVKRSYIDYAMSVIIGRALPDVRDGLKPVQRRILYAMYRMGMLSNKPYKKCARIVGEVLGKFHPHGDKAIYDALVRMAQNFSLRYTLIDGQGNFGSIDGDDPAAMRYTEARLTRNAEDMLMDIDKNTVDFINNFDTSLKEPSVLPSSFPNLLVNGSMGIAVGMATNIPPHNLSEVVDALILCIDKPNVSIEEIMQILKGPDFPTGAIIINGNNMIDIYKKGKGIIRIRARVSKEIEKDSNMIVVTELPYTVNKAEMIKKISELVRAGKIEGIRDIRDESDKSGIRIVIEVSTDPEFVLNQLYKHTDMEKSLGVQFIALTGNIPKQMNIKEMLTEFIKHREQVIYRKCIHDLNVSRKRLHIVNALLKTMDYIEDVIKIVRMSKDVEEAKKKLMKMLGIDKEQAKAVLEMRFQKLVSIETESLLKEKKNLENIVKNLDETIKNRRKILDIVKNELLRIKKTYADSRKTEIINVVKRNIEKKDLIRKENVFLILDEKERIKLISCDELRIQGRGGKGIIISKGEKIKIVKFVNTHDKIAIITNNGLSFTVNCYDIPKMSRYAHGILTKKINRNIEEIASIVKLEEKDIVFVTKNGYAKKINCKLLETKRNSGVRVIIPRDEISSLCINNGSDIFISTCKGYAVRFASSKLRNMKRGAFGVKAIKLRVNDFVSDICSIDGDFIIVVTKNGYGKLIRVNKFRCMGRACMGVICIKTNKKTGDVISSKCVKENDEVLIVTKKGMGERIKVRNISVMGRNARGIKLIKLNTGDEVCYVEVIRK